MPITSKIKILALSLGLSTVISLPALAQGSAAAPAPSASVPAKVGIVNIQEAIYSTNEGKQEVPSFYSNIDYMTVPSLLADTLYFHAQYRQNAPCTPVTYQGAKINLNGEKNHVYCETRGRGHLMGVTLGVLQNANGWWGEGDEMIFVDDESKPVINGTGSEDYFLGSWDFGGRDGAIPFGHAMYGAPLIANAERTGGRYCCYR